MAIQKQKTKQRQSITEDLFFGVLFAGDLDLLLKPLITLLDTPLFICSHMASA
jgi:hypothetical protein